MGINDSDNECECWCIFLYLNTNRVTRRRLFDELVTKSTIWGSSWIIAGDFNDIIDKSEKIGGRARESWCFNDFKNFIWKLNGIDLGYKRKSWTWWCYRENEGVIQERLDTDLGSLNWRAKFDMQMLFRSRSSYYFYRSYSCKKREKILFW